MSKHGHVRINSHGHTATVAIDGHEIHKGLAGLKLEMDGEELPRLVLEPLIFSSEVEIDGGPATVTVPRETADALVALGWTPPPDAS